jgi:fructose-specific component phosphotransferase system IIB-like protein
MDRIRKSLILLAVIGVPAAAHSTFAPADDLCFTSGATTFKLAPQAIAPDYRVRIGNGAARTDLRMQVVDRPEIADFVLVDDFSAAPASACRASGSLRTVKVDGGMRAPDVTVSLSAAEAAPDYKVYVHSVRYSQQDAAALLAVLWKTQQTRQLAESR